MALLKKPFWGNSLLRDFLDDPFLQDELKIFRGNRFIAANVKENEKSYDIDLAVPGFDKKDINITIENGMLTVSGEKKTERETKEDEYMRQEFNVTSFSRSFNLPVNTTEEDIQARCENGILKLSISKKEKAPAQLKKAIEIR
jgi:HSP20 family protein